ncbi:MAG: hypothetical protein FWD71_11390 [Oscillospiraceae bacterium]|nr:hypothetical protein [Oscillospiraceae bacterium]
MNKENMKNIEFINLKLIDTLNRISAEYSVSFDTLINLAVLKFIGDITLLRKLREQNIDLTYLSERILS